MVGIRLDRSPRQRRLDRSKDGIVGERFLDQVGHACPDRLNRHRPVFFGLYLFRSKTERRVIGYFEEEALIGYTHYLAEIDEGRSPDVPAPLIARRYWDLPDHATLREVVLVVRGGEAHHRLAPF